MPFSHGQISFALVFLAGFAIALIWAYRKDRKTNRKNFGAAWKVLITIIIVMATLSYILKNIRIH